MNAIDFPNLFGVMDFEKLKIINQNKYIEKNNPEIFKLLNNPISYYTMPRNNSAIEKDPIYKLLEEIQQATNNKTFTLTNGKKIMTDTEIKNHLKKMKKKGKNKN